VRAGSPTYPLDIVAGLSPDRHMLRIGVVNATFKPQRFELSLEGIHARGRGTQWLLTGKSLQAANKVGSPPGVTIAEKKVPALGSGLQVPPTSTVIFEFPVDG